MPTKRQVLAALGSGLDYRRAARALGIHPGQAYLVATGLPADGGDTYTSGELDRPGVVGGSTQALAYLDKPVQSSSEKPSVLEWIKQRAAADLPMREAAGERDAAPGEPLEEVTDITHVLSQQHDQVLVLLKQLKTIPGPSDGGSEVQRSRKASIVDMVSVALSRHEATEQEEFWPAVRSVLGDDVVEQALGQEQEGKDVLTALGKTSPDDDEFDELIDKLDKVARGHVAYEDRVLLRLTEAMTEDDRTQLGQKFLRAQKTAPTRPHPHAPKQPKAAVMAAGAAGAALDKVRDTLGDRPAERRGKAENEPEVPGPGIHDSGDDSDTAEQE